MKMQTGPLQSFGLLRRNFVRAADLVSQFEQKCSQSAHSGAGHANEMNPVMLAREPSGKSTIRTDSSCGEIDIKRARHWRTSQSLRQRGQPHLFAPAVRKSPTFGAALPDHRAIPRF